MKLFLRHHLFRILTLSRFLSSSGAYIYNLVFIVYAASLPFKNIAVFMANMITILPFLFTFMLGLKLIILGIKQGQLSGLVVCKVSYFF